MNQDELIERLKGYEWNDAEFKASQRGVSDSAYETVSAFANTGGGWLVFGVKEGQGSYEVVGVIEVDKVQNDFLSALRTGDKLSKIISAKESILEIDEKVLLVFFIPESRRQDKPVYLNGDIRRSFIRRGGGDERCTQAEIERFLREAADERYDGLTLDLDPEHCFDSESVGWYRNLFYSRKPTEDRSMSDLEFLHHWGLVVEKAGELLPTRASILLFGSTPAVLQVLPRPVVDYQWINADWADWADSPPERRWEDRLVIETNLIQAWKAILDRYLQRAEKPFSVNPENLQREDDPPDYIAFREAFVNLLIHQDYADHTRKPVIQFFRDRVVIWNPGDAFVRVEEMLEPGEREVRNPRIVRAFRHIGLSEQAGTGVRSIFNNWRQLGCVPPVINNDKANKFFELSLLKRELLSEKQLLFQASVGVRLSPEEAAAFASACQQDSIRLLDVKAVTGLSAQRAQSVLDRLIVQALIERVEATPQPHYIVVEHLRERLKQAMGETDQPDTKRGRLVTDQPPPKSANLVTDQPQPLLELTDRQWQIVMACDVPRSMATLMEALAMTHRTFFRRNHLDPMIKGGILSMRYPEQPNHPDQAYGLTEIGVELKARRLRALAEQNDSGAGK
ncbi:MAG: putative DNA binding domain-containing protein [Burkholderiaceae bacterium]|nr:putative DNA binding domain-containing protein [Burkholderiaceae bacterium]